jgi:hypothetical protein
MQECRVLDTYSPQNFRFRPKNWLEVELARFTHNPDELVILYRREPLRDMCRKAGIWRPDDRPGLSASSTQLARSALSARTDVFAECRNSLAEALYEQSSRFVISRSSVRTRLPAPLDINDLRGSIRVTKNCAWALLGQFSALVEYQPT